MKADIMSMGEKILWASDTELMYEAADVITALKERNARLVEALENILDSVALCDGYEVCQKDDFSDAKQSLAENKE
jgi:hypothetical protein